MISLTSRGKLTKTEKFLRKAFGRDYITVLHKYGEWGVKVLSEATPKDTGFTAQCWKYDVVQDKEKGYISVVWSNTHINNYVNIALILQYGHATGNGGYVQGRDYINPALRPIFDLMAKYAWEDITKG